MPLKKTNVSFPFSGGLDEKISEKVAPPGTLEVAENCQFDKNGEIEKRKGFETMWAQTSNWTDNMPLDSNIFLAGGKNVESHGDELVIADGERLFSYFDGYVKDKGRHLNCTFHNKDIFQDEVEKTGPVQHVRFETDRGDEYDLFVFTSTRPVGMLASQSPFVKAFYSIYCVDSGEPVVGPTEFASINRKIHTTVERTSITPAPQLMYIPALDTAFILYGDFENNAVRYFYKTIRLDSVSNFAISSATEITGLVDPSGTSAPTPCQAFFCMTADKNFTDSSTVADNNIFMAYYGSVGGKANDSGDLILLKLTCAGTRSTPALSLSTIKDVTVGAYSSSSSVNSQISSVHQKFGTKVNLSLRCTENTARPISLFYSVQDPNPPGGDYRIKCSSFDATLSTQTNVTFTGDHYVLLSATTVLSKTDSSTTSNHIVVNAVKDRDSDLRLFSSANGIGTITTTGTDFKDGVYNMPSTATFGVTPAKIYIPAAGGTPDTANITVLDGGNNLNAGFDYTIASPNASGAPGAVNAVYQFSSVGTPSERRQADSVILMDTHTMTVPANLTTVPSFRNCYLLSDLFHYEFNNLPSVTPSKTPYFLVSNPLGLGQTNSGTTAMVSFDEKLLAFGLPSEMPLSAHTEIHSMMTNKFSLMQSTQRVQIKGTKILVGSNRFVREVSTTDVAETGLGDSNVVFVDDIYNGTLITIDADPARSCPMLSLKDNLLLGGGALFSYDSTKIVESDFIQPPEFMATEKYKLAGGSFAATLGIEEGDYSYAAVFSSIDSKGNLHESAPVFSESINISTSEASAKTGIHVRVAVCNLTRRDRYRVDLYRTDSDGQIYYQIAGDIIRYDLPSIRRTEFIFNDNGSGALDIKSRPVIYTTGGIAQNFNPGSTTGLALHKDKVISTLPNGFIAVSKPALVGESISFPLVGPFVLNLGNVVKEVTATGSARDMLIVFTEDDVYAYMGDGPNALGSVGFTQPKLLSSGQGAIPGSFIVSSSSGMYYLSERGLYSVLSNGQIQYLSPQVESKLAPKAVVGMDLFDEQNELRVALGTGDILVYNYLFKRWSEWDTNIDIKAQTRHQPDSGNAFNSHVVINNSGSPARQSTNSFSDVSVSTAFSTSGVPSIFALAQSPYALKIKTTPISANQLFGAQRVYRAMILGEFLANNSTNAQMLIYLDYSPIPTSGGVISSTSDTSPYLYRIHLSRQKCRAVQLEFTDGGQSGNFVILSGIAFEIGGRPDTFKLPDSQTIQGLL